jgi:hypothetical protein
MPDYVNQGKPSFSYGVKPLPCPRDDVRHFLVKGILLLIIDQ